MYRFVSSIHPTQLRNAYLSLYNVKLLQKKLVSLLEKYPEIKDKLPNDISAKRLLVGSFKYLTRVFCAFTEYINQKNDSEKAVIIKSFVDGGFKYGSHQKDIAQFLMDRTNGFEIHNCVYCDLEDVTSFTKANGKQVRRFETEHVLDKGECPLVSLSLYNFVPSCKTCNGADIKGTKTIGDTEEEIVKLSPSVEGYDFNTHVRFAVRMITPGCNDTKAETHPGDYEVYFLVMDHLYQKSIDLFELKPRYNQDLIKVELLKWREKRRNNPDNIIQQYAEIQKVSFKEMFERMFELDLRRRKHYPMEKARREVMLMY